MKSQLLFVRLNERVLSDITSFVFLASNLTFTHCSPSRITSVISHPFSLLSQFFGQRYVIALLMTSTKIPAVDGLLSFATPSSLLQHLPHDLIDTKIFRIKAPLDNE